MYKSNAFSVHISYRTDSLSYTKMDMEGICKKREV